MKCESCIEKFLKADGTATPISVKLHIADCPSCRQKISAMQKAIVLAKETMPFTMEKDLSDSIMRQVMQTTPASVQSVSLLKWIAVGFVIFLGILLIPFNSSMHDIRLWAGGIFDIFITVVFGLFITIYVSLFTASLFKNDMFSKKIAKLIRS